MVATEDSLKYRSKMTHIKTILAKVIENASKAKFYHNNNAKFYHHNRDIFIKYFESIKQYQDLIEAGNFKKIQEIIREKTDFNINNFNN